MMCITRDQVRRIIREELSDQSGSGAGSGSGSSKLVAEIDYSRYGPDEIDLIVREVRRALAFLEKALEYHYGNYADVDPATPEGQELIWDEIEDARAALTGLV